MAERLNLSPDHQKYIDNSEPGAGLLIFENVILPFTNPIPSNTDLDVEAHKPVFNVHIGTVVKDVEAAGHIEVKGLRHPVGLRDMRQVIKLSPTSKDYVNPLDINLNYSEDENPLALKSDWACATRSASGMCWAVRAAWRSERTGIFSGLGSAR